MNSTGATAGGGAPTASTPVFLATFIGVLALIGVLLVLDLVLARADQRASEAHAADEYAAGRILLASGHPADAGERFGTAVAIDRTNVNYALALAEATMEAGRLAEAEATLRDLLDRAENDGAVNLTMAHVMVREQHVEQSKAYFHRAIFGRWGADSIERRIAARLELIDVLARRGATGELLAELLPLEDLAPDSIDFRLRIGRLFMTAGSPARSAAIFRAVLRRDPQSAEAYAGLGRAALELGNLRTARADLAAASRLRPDDGAIAKSLANVDSVAALDPSVREIDARERTARSQALLARTVSAVDGCSSGAAARAVLDSGRVLLATMSAPSRRADRADVLLSESENLWTAMGSGCPQAGRDSVLRWLQIHLAR